MSSPIHSWKKNKHTVQLEQKIRILKQMAWGKCQCCHLNNGDIPCLVWMGGLCPKQEAFFNVLGKFQYPVMHRETRPLKLLVDSQKGQPSPNTFYLSMDVSVFKVSSLNLYSPLKIMNTKRKCPLCKAKRQLCVTLDKCATCLVYEIFFRNRIGYI